jgi:hypothetical protein
MDIRALPGRAGDGIPRCGATFTVRLPGRQPHGGRMSAGSPVTIPSAEDGPEGRMLALDAQIVELRSC